MRLADAVRALNEVITDIAEGDTPITGELATLYEAAQQVVESWEQ